MTLLEFIALGTFMAVVSFLLDRLWEAWLRHRGKDLEATTDRIVEAIIVGRK